ncbi:MAG: hypothetical protein ABR986_07170, partial [Methanomassiliicoccales archaeon]
LRLHLPARLDLREGNSSVILVVGRLRSRYLSPRKWPRHRSKAVSGVLRGKNDRVVQVTD